MSLSQNALSVEGYRGRKALLAKSTDLWLYMDGMMESSRHLEEKRANSGFHLDLANFMYHAEKKSVRPMRATSASRSDLALAS